MTESENNTKANDFLPLVDLVVRNWGKVTTAIIVVSGTIGSAYWNHTAVLEQKAALEKEVELLNKQIERNDRKCNRLQDRIEKTNQILGLEQLPEEVKEK